MEIDHIRHQLNVASSFLAFSHIIFPSTLS